MSKTYPAPLLEGSFFLGCNSHMGPKKAAALCLTHGPSRSGTVNSKAPELVLCKDLVLHPDLKEKGWVKCHFSTLPFVEGL